jgi:hypothetical protein
VSPPPDARHDAPVKREAQVLHDKAISSITVATTAFNSPSDIGRVTQVLLSLQHSFEMLLKAALVQHRVKVFDKRTGRSNGFATCLGQAQGHAVIKISGDDAGTLRAIDAMRDDEQHWFNEVSEQLLYRYARAAITIFDELLDRVFGERLATYLPNRVLPISTDAPKDLTLLLDDEYSQIVELLKPRRRMREHARARIRTLLAMEAHQEPDTRVSDKDVARVEKGILAGKKRAEVFPKLEGLGTEVNGTGVNITVHFSKKGEGAAVHFVSDDSEDSAAIREVDLNARFSRPAKKLAGDLGITMPVATALRDHLAVDRDPTCFKDFKFGQSSHRAYSDKAFSQMRVLVKSGDSEAIRRAHNPRRGKRFQRCSVPGCRAGTDSAEGK